MVEFVKICPRCGHVNPENELTCEKVECQEILEFEEPRPRPAAGPAPGTPGPGPAPRDHGSHDQATDSSRGEAVPRQQAGPMMYLYHEGLTSPVAVADGKIVGQKHATSRADVQLDGFDDVGYISREHFLFTRENGTWYVEVLPTASNSTTLNNRPVERGRKIAISNGDRLRVANRVTLQVRLLTP